MLINELGKFTEKYIEDTLYYEAQDDNNRMEAQMYWEESEARITQRSNELDKALIALNKKDPGATGSLQINF